MIPINKKERVIAAVRGQKIDYIPVGLWMHFPAQMHHGDEAVKAHSRFFRETDSDILKVMNGEVPFEKWYLDEILGDKENE